VRWRRQSVIRGYILDFYCPTFHIGVEVDGSIHDPQKDAIRDQNILRGTGIHVLRFSNDAVQNNICEVLQTLREKVWSLGFSTNPQDSSSSKITINRRRLGEKHLRRLDLAVVVPVEVVEKWKT
jgi:hypothetical protein